MNFKLANLSTINQKYGKTIEQMKDAIISLIILSTF